MSAQQVAHALRGIAAQEAHARTCIRFLALAGQRDTVPCDCDRNARVAARQAEAVLAAIEAAYITCHSTEHVYRREAALRVLAQRAEGEKP